MWRMQPVVHTTSRGFLEVSTGALEVLGYLRRSTNSILQLSLLARCVKLWYDNKIKFNS